jgi:hypothetical protein
MSQAELLTGSGHNKFKGQKTRTQFRAKRESHDLSEAGRQMPGASLLHHRQNIREGKVVKGEVPKDGVTVPTFSKSKNSRLTSI